MKLSGADILWSCLVEQGVDTVFGYPGGAMLPAYDRLLDHPIRHVLVRHERSAADGATAQATIMFESTDKTAARVAALLGRQVGVLAVEEWNDDDSRR